jgi:hypothetical protein
MIEIKHHRVVFTTVYAGMCSQELPQDVLILLPHSLPLRPSNRIVVGTLTSQDMRLSRLFILSDNFFAVDTVPPFIIAG